MAKLRSYRRPIRRCFVWVCAALCFLPLVAAAQASPGDKAMAEMLFDRGLTLMKQGHYEEACAQLERSQQVEGGIGAMLYLAECYERMGRTASAWALFREASSAARAEGHLDRAKQGTTHADKLEPLLSKLTINVPNPVPGLLVLRNGQTVPKSVFGSAVPMDPGELRFDARALGYAPWTLTIELPDNGAALSVDVPALSPLPAAQRLPPAAAESAEPQAQPDTPAVLDPILTHPMLQPTPQQPQHSVQGPIGAILSGAGVIGLGVGAYFGARAIAKNNAAEDACPGRVCSSAPARQLDDQAHSAATLSNVFVIGGAALLVGGAVLYFTRPNERAPHLALSVSPRAAAVILGGSL